MRLYKIIFLILLLSCIFYINTKSSVKNKGIEKKSTEITPYPSELWNFLFFGMKSLAIDYIYLKTIQISRQKIKGDLFSFLKEGLKLDKKFISFGVLGAWTLVWHNQPENAIKFLNFWEKLLPKNWIMNFEKGKIYWFVLEDYKNAAKEFYIAYNKSKNTKVLRFSAYIYYKYLGDMEKSRQIWEKIYKETKSKREKKIAEMYLKFFELENQCNYLELKAKEFYKIYKRYPQSIAEFKKIVKVFPKEPFGKYFLIDIRNGKIYSYTQIEFKLKQFYRYFKKGFIKDTTKTPFGYRIKVLKDTIIFYKPKYLVELRSK